MSGVIVREGNRFKTVLACTIAVLLRFLVKSRVLPWSLLLGGGGSFRFCMQREIVS